jgi:putative oxidoreductase
MSHNRRSFHKGSVTMLRSDDTGKLVLRLTLGVLVLLHGIAKLSDGGAAIGGISRMLSARDLPGALAYLVYIGEVLAPVLLIAGIYTRMAAWIVAINMAVAFWLVHTGQLAALGKSGGWAPELPGMFLFAALALALLGAGRFSVGGSGGRYN